MEWRCLSHIFPSTVLARARGGRGSLGGRHLGLHCGASGWLRHGMHVSALSIDYRSGAAGDCLCVSGWRSAGSRGRCFRGISCGWRVFRPGDKCAGHRQYDGQTVSSSPTPRQLTVTLNSQNLAQAGLHQVTVVNPSVTTPALAPANRAATNFAVQPNLALNPPVITEASLPLPAGATGPVAVAINAVTGIAVVVNQTFKQHHVGGHDAKSARPRSWRYHRCRQQAKQRGRR